MAAPMNADLGMRRMELGHIVQARKPMAPGSTPRPAICCSGKPSSTSAVAVWSGNAIASTPSLHAAFRLGFNYEGSSVGIRSPNGEIGTPPGFR